MKILDQLAALAPKRRPATAKDFAAIEAAVGSVPEDLRALYELAGNLDRVGAEEGLHWLSPSGAVASWKMNRKIVAEFPARALPIATDQAGNFACYDTKTRRIVDWDHETRKVTALAPSLERFVEKELVAPLRRETKEKAAIAGSKKIRAGEGPIGLPSKIVQESFPLLSKVDRPGYGGGACSVLFLSDDRLLVTFGQLGALIELGGKQEQHVSRGGTSAIASGGDRVICCEFRQIALVDAKTCKTLGRWQTSALEHPIDAAFSRDGTAATTDTSGALLLWNTKKLKNGSTDEFQASYTLPKATPAASLEGHEGWTFCSFAGDGVLASGDAKGLLCLWRGKQLVAKANVRDEIKGVSFSKDGERIFLGLGTGAVEVRDRALKRVTQWKTKGDGVVHLRVLASGAVATLGYKLLQLWDPASGKLLAKIARKKNQTLPRISDERGSLLVTAGPAALYRLT